MHGRASLNHVFRTVWNQALGAMVAVAEIASSGGRSAGASRSRVARHAVDDAAPALRAIALSILVALLASPAHAQTLPSGGVAVHGGAAFNLGGTSINSTQPNRLTVTTTHGAGSNHSAINWNSFSIGSGNTAHFVQPNAASLSINRVVTNTPSQLFGSLSSNGKLVLVNQSGIAVGAGAVVDTAGFTASALGLSQADAIAGRLRFNGAGGGASSANLTVHGNIIARGGDVVLIAPNVDIGKTALVESQGGSVVLAAGQSVEVTGRGLEGITLQVQAPSDQALNLGTLKGDAVGIFAGTLRHSGMIQAVQANMEGGKVVLRALGDAYVEGQGRINATSAVGKGGSVDVLGNRVAIAGQSLIDVSGQQGGGSIRVGGDFQGNNVAVENAHMTYLGPDATLKADAVDSGDGGRVIVWADQQTQGYGTISARGGARSGDGGFVEVSGKQKLAFAANVNTLAPMGKAGTLLLDPLNIDVSVGGGTALTNVDQFADLPGVSAVVSPAVINGALSNVVLQATDDINFNDPVTMTNPGVGLTAQAGGIIAVQAPITTSGGHITLYANAPGAGGTGPNGSAVVVNAAITTNGGAIILRSDGSDVGGNSVVLAANVNAGTGAITLLAPNDRIEQTGGALTGASLSATADYIIDLNRPGNSIPGNVILSSNLATTSGTSLHFTNSAPSFNLIEATSKGSVSITTTGSVSTSGSPITSATGNILITAPTGMTLNSVITASGSLNLNSSAGNGSVVQSGGSITAGIGASVTTGTGNVTLNSAGNSFDNFSTTSAGAVSVTNGGNLLNLQGSNAASFSVLSGGNINFATASNITTTSGAIDIRSTGGGINLNPAGGTALGAALNSAAGIKLEATGNVGLVNAALGAGGGGDIKIGSTSGLLNATGATSLIATGGRWLTYLTNPAAAHAFGPFRPTGFGTNFRQVNAPIGTAPLGTGNGSLWSDSGAPTGSLTGSVTKVFDGSNTISLAGATFVPGGGYLFGETGGSFLAGATGTMANPNVGVAKAVAASALPLSGVQIISTLTTPTYGYVLTSASGNIGTVTPAALSIITLGGLRAYDGTNIVNADIFSLSGLIGTQTLTLAGAGTVADKNIGVAKPVTLGSLVLGNGTGSASNYTLAGGVHVATITPVNVSIAGLAPVSKVYDGTTVAVVSTASAALVGAISGDSLGFSGGTGVFSDKNAGVGKPVGISGLALTGADAGNYNLVNSNAVGVADIFKASIAGVTGITASNKVYDGTSAATLSALAAQIPGLISGDSVSVRAATGQFSDKNVGLGKVVTIAGLSLAGSDAGNYTLANASATALADITKAPVTAITGISANAKIYDASTAATLDIASAKAVGLITGDAVTVSALGQFADKNAGLGKTVNLTGIGLSGIDADNYNFTGPTAATVSANILRKPITSVSGITANDKVYDGNNSATLVGAAVALGGVIGGDVVSFGSGTGAFSDRHVGSNKAVNITGVVLSGVDAGNYSVAGDVKAASANITQRPGSIWTGDGSNTLWSNPANWDALPDRNNVLAVSIPAGAGQVTFDAAVDPTLLQSLTSGQTLAMTGGSLGVTSDLNLPGLLLTGGTLKGAGNLTVASSFNQTGGSLQVARDVTINQASGNLLVGEILARRVDLKASVGGISQTAGLDTPTLVAQAATGMVLTQSANKIGSVMLTNTGKGNMSLSNNGPLDAAGIRNAEGDVTLINTGGINTSGLIHVPQGDLAITANSPLRIGNDGLSAGGNVTLVATNITGPGNILIDGPIAAGGAVTMKAGNNLTQNAAIFGADGVTATANGAFSYGPLAFTSRAPVSYSVNGERVRPPINPVEARTRTNSPDAVIAFLDQFGRAQRRQIFDTVVTNPDGTPVKRRDRDAVVSELREGNVCSR